MDEMMIKRRIHFAGDRDLHAGEIVERIDVRHCDDRAVVACYRRTVKEGDLGPNPVIIRHTGGWCCVVAGSDVEGL